MVKNAPNLVYVEIPLKCRQLCEWKMRVVNGDWGRHELSKEQCRLGAHWSLCLWRKKSKLLGELILLVNITDYDD